jgi:hypothetical protein
MLVSLLLLRVLSGGDWGVVEHRLGGEGWVYIYKGYTSRSRIVMLSYGVSGTDTGFRRTRLQTNE